MKKLFALLAFCCAALPLPCPAQVYMFFNKDPGQFSSQIQTDSAAAYAAAKAAGAVTGIVVELASSAVDCGNATTGPAICTTAMQNFDNDIKAIIGNPGGADKVGVIFDSVQGGTGAGGENNFTPSYVFSTAWAGNALCVGCSSSHPQDVAYCNNYQGTAANGFTQSNIGSNVYNISDFPAGGSAVFDNSGAPLVWEPPFVNWYEQVIPILISWYKNTSIWKNQMGYFRWGLAAGGGSVVSCPNVMSGTYSVANGGTANQAGFPSPTTEELTRTLWQNYHTAIYSTIAANTQGFVHEGSGGYGGVTLGNGDGSTPISWADDDYVEAIANGLGIGTQSLTGNATNGDQIEYAQGSSCNADWCAAFNTYCAGQLGSAAAPICYLQTTSASNPGCLLQPSSCNGGNLTGSLLTTGPFATERHTKTLEIAYLDFLLAYSANGCTDDSANCGSVTTPYAPYQRAILNMQNGVPNATAARAGNTVVAGKSGIQ